MGPSRTPSRTSRSGTALPAVSLLGPVGALVAVVLLRDHPGAGAWVATGGILLGVPHGAADHLVPFWAGGGRTGWRPVAGLLAGYLLTLALALTAVLAAPRWALAAFLLLSAAHFGRGDTVFAAQRAGRPTPTWRDDVLVSAAHGLVVVGLPLARWPSTSLPLLDQVAPGFSSWASGWAGGRPDPLLALTAAVGSAALVRLAGRRRWGQAGELAVLGLLFWLVDPLTAFGVYFALWHSARHVLRLVMLPGPVAGPGVTARTAGDLRRGLRRYLRAATLPTAVSVALLAAIWSGRGSSLLSAELSTLVALTAPHLLVVGRLDAVLARRGTPARSVAGSLASGPGPAGYRRAVRWLEAAPVSRE